MRPEQEAESVGSLEEELQVNTEAPITIEGVEDSTLDGVVHDSALTGDMPKEEEDTTAEEQHPSEPLVKLAEVTVAQEDYKVLSHVNLEVYPGDFYYLVGKVGSGKTTLISMLMGELPLMEGEGMVCGFNLRTLRRREIPYLRRRMGVIFQDFKLLNDRSVERNLQFALRATGWKSPSAIAQRIEEVLTLVGLKHKAYKMPAELSGGEQQRVTIARALLNEPSLILADEPTGNLDPETSSGIVSLLHDLAQEGKAVIMATHNHAMVSRFSARVLQCYEGELRMLPSQLNLDFI